MHDAAACTATTAPWLCKTCAQHTHLLVLLLKARVVKGQQPCAVGLRQLREGTAQQHLQLRLQLDCVGDVVAQQRLRHDVQQLQQQRGRCQRAHSNQQEAC